jgi:hypothetical protein
MSQIVSDFINSFENATEDQMGDLLDCWWPPPRFTRYVKHQMMPQIATDLGLGIALEFQRVDIVLPFAGETLIGAFDFRQVSIAVEHENSQTNAHEEIRKLRRINVPLGVLITYATEKKRPIKLEELASHIMEVDRSTSSALHGQLLVIFGNYGKEPPAKLEWDYHLWQHYRFAKVKLAE